jgi:hypothetical protein
MHGQIGGPYYKGKGGGGSVASTHDGNTSNNTGGTGGESLPQKPIPGAEGTYSQKKGTSPQGSGPGLPNKSTSFAGSVR